MGNDYLVEQISNNVFGSIRYTIVNGIPYYCLTDICSKLSLTARSVSKIKDTLMELYNYRNIIPYTNPDTIGVIPVLYIPTTVQTGVKSDGTPALQTVNIIYVNEGGVFYAIFNSNKPEAMAFKYWVCYELLPVVKQIGYNKSLQSLQQYNMRLIRDRENLESAYGNLQSSFSNQAIDFAFACGDRDKYRNNIESANFLTEEQKQQLLNLEDNNEERQESY